MFERSFKFPIILVDGNQEEVMRERAYSKDTYPEYIEGYAEVPYDLFSHINDFWKPDEESYSNAKDGIFNACLVTFEGCGTFMVPMNRKEFKERIEKFAEKFELKQEE